MRVGKTIDSVSRLLSFPHQTKPLLRCIFPAGGICGATVADAQCRSSCVAQQWSWNYLSCLEQYFMGKQRSHLMFRTDGGHKDSNAPYVATSSGCCCVPLYYVY
jgi:hypothetical protein